MSLIDRDKNGGGGGGVQSVTGDAVDNTDPLNPTISKGASIILRSQSTINLGNATNPSFLLNAIVEHSRGVTLTDASEGVIRNDTGRPLNMIGSFSYNPDQTSGGRSVIHIISETSTDGVTWTGNLNSDRKVEITSSTESWQTKSSDVVGWQPGDYLRFRFFTGQGGIRFVVTGVEVLGQVFNSPSVRWSLAEV